MKAKAIIFFLFVYCVTNVAAQPTAPTSFRFDLGSGVPAKGYTKVSTTTMYNEKDGYGFEPGADLVSVKRNGKDPLKDDGITSDKPFLFSVRLPEGNYNVVITMGDQSATTFATVKAECRRLMVKEVKAAPGRFETVRITVNIRDSLIHGTTQQVRLKPREHNYLHWDNKLTLEFNGAAPNVCAIEITPARDVVTVFLAGNSTVVDQAEEPYAAWGQMIPSFFQPGKVAICNLAESGESLSSFISARRLQKGLSLMKPGDYFFVEFAHNDQKQKGPGIGAFTSYTRDLKTFISEVRKKGGIPVLVTSMNRRSFDSSGSIVNTLGDYPAAMRQTAQEENAPLIDLNAMSKVLYEAWGEQQSIKAFVHYPANTFPGQDKALADNTHFNPYGAYEIARCVVNGIRQNVPALAQYLKKDIPSFNPSQPDPIASFNWPLSVHVAAVKPDGN